MTGMISPGHFLQDAASGLPHEISEVMLTGRELRMERIVSHGQASPPGYWYDQDEHEWVLLLSGSARLEFDEPARVLELRPGDAVTIPAHERHRVAATAPGQDTVWLAVFYKPQ